MDCSTLVELVRSPVVVVVVELLQLRFVVASAKLLDVDFLVGFVVQLVLVVVVV